MAYVRLARMARNLREGDEVWMHDEAAVPVRRGRVRLVRREELVSDGPFTGQKRVRWEIERVDDVFLGRPWPGRYVTFYANDTVALMRPRREAA